MGSEDVIHSFYIPAFRVKADVIPGRYNTMWFTATRPGQYHLFCAEYCGTKHSGMIGTVIAMEPPDFQDWLSGGRAGDSPVAAGAKLFQDLACNTCHLANTQGRGAVLIGVYGKPVQLEGGGTVIADDAYIRESIMNPQAKVVAGFEPIMPTFQGQVTEEQLLQLIAYVRSLGAQGAPAVPIRWTAWPTAAASASREVTSSGLGTRAVDQYAPMAAIGPGARTGVITRLRTNVGRYAASGMRGSDTEVTCTPAVATRRAVTTSPLPATAAPRQSNPGPRFEMEPGA